MASLPINLPGLRIQSISSCDKRILIFAATIRRRATCPACGKASRQVHSFYIRRPRDLPLSGVPVELRIQVRRFRCQESRCRKKTFAERLPDLLPPYSRRTARLTLALRHIGFALSGEAGARLAHRLAMPVSGDTLIRIILRTPMSLPETTQIIGVDDWAWRKGNSYGTVLVDLEAHRIIELLPDRTAKTLAECLKKYPAVRILTRDRSMEYASGMRLGAPDALQIADRWHLIRNLAQMTERLHSRLRKHIKGHSDERTSPNESRRFARSAGEEELRNISRAKKQKRYEIIKYLHTKGLSIRQTARTLGISTSTVNRFLNGENPAERRQRASIIDPYLDYLERRWKEGCENAAQLWREIKDQGVCR